MGRLDGKVAIVTGAASGIGRASALAMADEGAWIAVADIDLRGAEDVVADAQRRGGTAMAIEVDVADPAAVEHMVRRTVDELGRVDVLFNNAAVLTPDVRARDTDVVDLDLEVWHRTMAVNLTGPMLGCRFAVPEMRKRGGGSIINSSSAAAGLADVVRCAYGTSKGGLNSLTRYVAAAFGKDGIRCNAIAPGVVLTPAVRALQSDDALAEFALHHTTPRLGTPEDVAGLAVYLASDQSGFLTGQVLTVDGGLSCHLPTYAATLRKRSDGAG